MFQMVIFACSLLPLKYHTSITSKPTFHSRSVHWNPQKNLKKPLRQLSPSSPSLIKHSIRSYIAYSGMLFSWCHQLALWPRQMEEIKSARYHKLKRESLLQYLCKYISNLINCVILIWPGWYWGSFCSLSWCQVFC